MRAMLSNSLAPLRPLCAAKTAVKPGYDISSKLQFCVRDLAVQFGVES